MLYPTKDIKEEAFPNCDMKLWRRWNTALCVLIGGNTVRDHSIFFALYLRFLFSLPPPPSCLKSVASCQLLLYTLVDFSLFPEKPEVVGQEFPCHWRVNSVTL